MHPLSFRARSCVALLAVYLSAAPALPARIGETQQALEARLLKTGGGRKIVRTANEKDRERDERDGTLTALRPYLPADAEEVAYFKPIGRASSEAGWRLQVALVGNKSFFEAYRRVGGQLSEFEINGILALNRSNSTWRKLAEGESPPSGLGCDFVLEDGSLRAKVDSRHNQLLVFASKFDVSIFEKKRAERERREAEQKLGAPESLAGF